MGSSTKYVLKGIIKIVVIVILAICMFIAGTMIGYGSLGKGNKNDVLEKETWTHIMDFIK